MLGYKSYKKVYPNIKIKDAKDGLFPCFYCGIKSNSIDHFIPISFIENIRHFIDLQDSKEDIYYKIRDRQQLIPSCKECNCLASDGFFNNPNEKKSYIKAKLRKRYKRILWIPKWNVEEIEELGYSLRVSVQDTLSLQKLVKQRLLW